jgi:dihydrofolate synthase/folylpolyglutamate synthase
MSYAAAVDHLHGLTQELALAAATPPRKFDLDHMRVLAGALGDPQRRSTPRRTWRA